MKNTLKWQQELRTFLQSFGDEIHLLSTEAGAPHILSFSVRGLKGEILINALQKEGVIVSTSSACSSKQTKTSHVVEALKIDQAFKNGVLRLSFGMLTTDADMKAFKKAFRASNEAIKRRISRMIWKEILIRYGELSTKGRNKNDFINRLRENVRYSFNDINAIKNSC